MNQQQGGNTHALLPNWRIWFRTNPDVSLTLYEQRKRNAMTTMPTAIPQVTYLRGRPTV